VSRKRIADVEIGPDADLDVEEVYLDNGTRPTETKAEELAERTLARLRPGRPTITGRGGHTPSLTVRVPRETRAALEEIAARQGRRLADVSREALDNYIASQAG